MLDRPLYGLPHRFAAHHDPPALRQVERVDHVHRFGQKRLDQRHHRQPLERPRDPLGQFAVGPQRDRVETLVRDGRQNRPHPLRQLGIALLLRRKVHFHPAGVDRAHQPLAAQVRQNARHHIRRRRRLGFLRRGPQVRRHHHLVAQLEDFLVHGGRFRLIHVDRRAGHVARLDRFRQRHFVDQSAPRRVDKPHALLALGDLRRAQQRLAARRVNADVVAQRQQRLQVLDHLHLAVQRRLGKVELVVGHHLHVHRQAALGHRLADAPKADDPQRLARELRAHERLAVPLAGAQRGVGQRYLPRQRHHQGDGVLRRRDRVGVRRVHHQDARFGRRFHVHVVHAHAGAGDHPQLARMGQFRPPDVHRRADDHPVVLAQRRGQFPGAPFFLARELDIGLGLENRQTLRRQGVRHEYFKHLRFSMNERQSVPEFTLERASRPTRPAMPKHTLKRQLRAPKDGHAHLERAAV